MIEITPGLVEQAIARDRRAVRALVDALSPVVQSRVARVLLRRGASRARNVREEVKDLSQHVFAVIFADDASVLRHWDPARGLSLVNFIGLVAEREVGTVLRSRRKSPWTEEPAPAEDLDEDAASSRGPERVTGSREVLVAVLDAVRAQLSDHGLELFELLIVEGCSVEEVCASTGKNTDAVYAWRSRLMKLVTKAANEILSDNAPRPRTPAGRS